MEIKNFVPGKHMSFVHLHVHSEYSLLRSVAKIDRLVREAKLRGFHSLALTDIDAMYGVVRFYQTCREHGIQPIIGVELAYSEDGEPAKDNEDNRIVLLAKNNNGYRALTQLTTRAHEKSSRFGPYVTPSELTADSNSIIAIIPFEDGLVQNLINQGRASEAFQHFQWLRTIFGEENVYLEIQNHWRPADREKLLKISEWLKTNDVPVVASNHVHFIEREQMAAHRVIQGIRLGLTLNEIPSKYSSEEYYLKSAAEMEELFQAWPQAIAATEQIAAACRFELKTGKVELPEYPTDDQKPAKEYLRQLCEKGVDEKYRQPADEVWERLNCELDVISEMNYEDYFLIVADFMNFAARQGIVTGPGRGSAAGSIVAYVLGITKVDPLKYGLLFERFLNPERVSMPDIDIDFQDDRRDEVIHYVKSKYGREHVAQIITFGTLAAKAVIRDVGRVLDIELAIIDRLAKNIPSRPSITLTAAISESSGVQEMIQQNDKLAELIGIAKHLEGLPRHSSVHAAGIVMNKNRLTDIVPLQEGNDGLHLTQYPMGDLETLGLLKMDFLGLRNLSFIQKILQLIEKNHAKKLSLAAIPFDDPATFALLGKGDTSGVFQLESAGMKGVLRRLKPTDFEDIVAVNALYRPGPMENIPTYIRRKHGEETVSYPHVHLQEILEPTYGVLIYQEQIMQIASKMAGFSLGEADILRRAVGKKKREVLEEKRQQFTEGAVKKGYSTEEAGQVYDLIVRFADYGFNRSHAVAYSIVAYQLAYLKANFPLEFMCALMGTVVHYQEKLGEYVAEARRKGLTVHPPSIVESEGNFTVKNGEIWIGLESIKNVGTPAVKEMVKERNLRPFTSLFDLCTRIPGKLLPKRAIDSMIAAGALDPLHENRAQLLASTEIAMEYGESMRLHQTEGQTELFIDEATEPEYISVPPLSEAELLDFEKQVLGFYASGHPVETYLPVIKQYRRATIMEGKAEKAHDDRIRIAGLVEKVKTIQTKKKQQMAFLKLSDETGDIDVTVFPESYQAFKTKFHKGELLFIEGKLQEHGGERKLILEKCTSVSALEKKEQQKQQPVLYLKITYFHEKKGSLTQLKKLLQDDPGDVPVVLFYEHANKAMHLSEMWNVSGEEKLLLKLKGLLGQENVFLKSRR
ncbi:DNA polymerase-3 subunit alpha [Evansella caseinilytica]|uniref:DNA polymerase III subunit alpha n=1 Tax=Evansella caseinilytica TaxID=1503961 RepID=A0A1H3TX04_9BACI|nr:DNA polymerase III subunit alpha [Evansella caseinilytica]SDZ54607.1 DNA polymerase-3 subunit alpha [Evansella caseinilytica]